MKRLVVVVLLLATPIILSGCVSLIDDKSDRGTNEDATQTETPVLENTKESNVKDGCEIVDKGVDPVSTMCSVEEQPPDIRVDSKYTEKTNISISIRKRDTVTYTRNITLLALEEQTLNDVITTSGDYTIQGAIPDGSIAEEEWKINERYEHTGDVQWVIEVTSEKNIRIFRVSTY
jgi:hypothetical protein